MFQRTTAINKLLAMSARIRVVPGGTSAGKTFGILPILIDTATKTQSLEISVVSESIPHLRKGALKDFIKIMKDTGRWLESRYNKTLLTYTFANGSYIEFFSADQEGKVRGPRRNILYINECNNVSFSVYHQLAIRTDTTIWLDFNPVNEFWAHHELKEEPDAEWITLTYLDNEALQVSIVREIEKAREKAKTSSYWENWWKVYGLGETGRIEGVVFNNWSIVDKLPDQAQVIARGIDFGFTNDPTAMVAAYQYNSSIIWDEEIYETGLTNPDIARLMKSHGVQQHDFVVADSAEPKSITELNRYGFKVKGATKGKDSISFGISILQENEFKVTARSVNLIRELRRYAWDTDKDGNHLNRPVDAFNHAIDAMRYVGVMKLSKQKQTMGAGSSKLI